LLEYKKHSGMNEIHAKVCFVKLCRSLKTYGITLFEVRQRHRATETEKERVGMRTNAPSLSFLFSLKKVQQKDKGQKMETILIGVSREAIIRMDPRTKEIVKTNQLTELKRWSASPKSFTFDFGDSESDYYTVTTTQAEALSVVHFCCSPFFFVFSSLISLS
jgi:talin